MSGRTAAGYTFSLVAVLVLVLVAGSALGQPMLLSYVETGSMSPTLEPGDGFVAVPPQLAGPIQEGDVVVFQAREVQGGGLTTHRVVAETDRGYTTKGDANPFTDQDGGEPPVKRAQIVAVAWQPGGSVVTIPHVGTAVEGIQSTLIALQRHIFALLGTRAFLGVRGLAYLVFALTLVWYGIGEWRSRTTKERAQSRDSGTSVRLIVGTFAVVLVGAATAAMVVPAGTQAYGIAGAEFESDHPTVVPAGQSKTVEKPLANGGLLPVVVHLEPASDGVDVRPRRIYLSGGERANATVTLHTPDESGYYRRFVTQYRYLAVLPASIIETLYRFHPWAPIVVIDALVAVPFYLLGVGLTGTGRLRERSRGRDIPLSTRCRRALRHLY